MRRIWSASATMFTVSRSALLCLVATSAMLAAGCSTIPTDGPSSRAVNGGALSPGSAAYATVDLTYEATERMKAAPLPFAAGLTDPAPSRPTDLISAGDQILVTIFEPVGSLFGRNDVGEGARQTLPAMEVGRDGAVRLPYVGPIAVSGMTSAEAAEAIRRSLRGRAVNPQVVVTVAQSVVNSVVVLGEAKAPGRQPLRPGADSVLDVIAAAGGSIKPPEDIVLSIQRAGRTTSAPLDLVLNRADQNIKLAPGDAIQLIHRPRKFNSFGALGRVSQVDFGPGPVSLADALGRSGGLDGNSADARSVFLFRFERPEVARALGVTTPATPRGVPIIYRLNVADPAGFFAAQNFQMMSDDLIYAPRARSAELRKFFETVQSITRVVYDIQVASTLNND